MYLPNFVMNRVPSDIYRLKNPKLVIKQSKGKIIKATIILPAREQMPATPPTFQAGKVTLASQAKDRFPPLNAPAMISLAQDFRIVSPAFQEEVHMDLWIFGGDPEANLLPSTGSCARTASLRALLLKEKDWYSDLPNPF